MILKNSPCLNKYVYIYTNAHVVNSSSAVNFEVIYYNNIRVKATVLAKDGEEDVAILQAEIEPNRDYLEATVGNSDALKIGQTKFKLMEINNSLYKSL